MTTALYVLSLTTVALAAALILQSMSFAAERKALLESFRGKARDDVRAHLATSAIDYARAQATEDAIVERAREDLRRPDEPAYEGMG